MARAWREERFLLTCAAVVIGSAIAGSLGLYNHNDGQTAFLIVPAVAAIAFGMV